MVKLFSKNSNLCNHNTSTLRTDRQTDDMRSQYRALHLSASRGNKLSASRTAAGRLFHTTGPATEKALSPSLVLVRGTV